ncbi:hypothetical protein FO519_002025 [Halicephalobus sp. NKZ332]|nr:hypothetical protein FO519_002025 [Halicephalobus sp. NKZ332]
MRLLICTSFFLFFFVSAFAADSATSTDCYVKLANIMINLNGNFFTSDQIQRLIGDMGNMYYDGVPLPEICTYLRNQQATYCTSEQMNTIADITKKITDIVGSSQRTAQLFNISFSEALDFIKADQTQLDQMVAKEKSEGAPKDTVLRDMCRFICQKYTPEKRAEIAKRILGYITPEHRQAIQSLLTTVINLDGIDINNVGTTPAGFQGF